MNVLICFNMCWWLSLEMTLKWVFGRFLQPRSSNGCLLWQLQWILPVQKYYASCWAEQKLWIESPSCGLSRSIWPATVGNRMLDQMDLWLNPESHFFCSYITSLFYSWRLNHSVWKRQLQVLHYTFYGDGNDMKNGRVSVKILRFCFYFLMLKHLYGRGNNFKHHCLAPLIKQPVRVTGPSCASEANLTNSTSVYPS